MLDAWLGTLSLSTFRSEYLRRAPVAQPGTVDPAVLDWQRLGEILPVAPPRDVLVVARGDLLAYPPPTALDELRAYFRMGIGLALHHTEACHPALRVIADDFARIGPSHVQMFVTPGGTHGFGWHFDDEDVFIAQTVGVKDYYFRANTVANQTAEPAAFARHAEETSPLMSATLCAGDFLYLPARWWHMAICRETALSISVGVHGACLP